MVNKYTLVVFCALLAGCEQAKQIGYISPSCNNSQMECRFNNSLGQFEVKMNVSNVTPETPFEITIEYTGEEELQNLSGFLEGRDMYMGKIPLLFAPIDGNSHRWRTTTMLGICSESQMVWQMRLTIISKNQMATLDYQFVSFES